jgi:hypothetical protein
MGNDESLYITSYKEIKNKKPTHRRSYSLSIQKFAEMKKGSEKNAWIGL